MIPDWDTRGLLPPAFSPGGFDRSPYPATVLELVEKFGPLSTARRDILTGFLDFREGLHKAGLIQGFHWLDGSFLEDIETNGSRPPNDVDVVTFVDPLGANLGLEFVAPGSKTKFMVDSYFVELTMPTKNLIELCTYWYSMWSHRRDSSWKGFLQVDLDPINDSQARTLLSTLNLNP